MRYALCSFVEDVVDGLNHWPLMTKIYSFKINCPNPLMWTFLKINYSKLCFCSYHFANCTVDLVLNWKLEGPMENRYKIIVDFCIFSIPSVAWLYLLVKNNICYRYLTYYAYDMQTSRKRVPPTANIFLKCIFRLFYLYIF